MTPPHPADPTSGKVYVLLHDDRSYDMGDTEVRGVFATREAAEASIVTRTPSGTPSKAWSAHNESCCGVIEYDVEGGPVADVQEDDPPMADGEGGRLIPDALADAMLDVLRR